MAIEMAFESLQGHLEKLKDELGELRVNAEDFYPPGSGRHRRNGHSTAEAPPPVVALADKAADLEGEIEEALQAAKKATRAVRHPRNLVEAQIAMTSIQRSLNRVLRQHLAEVAAYDFMQTLMQMGRELGDAWPKWTQLIKSVINDCRDLLVAAFQALAECWQELADKLATNSVSVQATAIGQQITVRETMPEDVHDLAR